MSWEHVRSSYDTVAVDYDARFHDELDRKPRDRQFLEEFARNASDPVLEIGCGPGHIGAFVGRTGLSVIGLDLSTEMAQLASLRLAGAVIADMRRLPLRSVGVGGLIAFYSIIHLRRGELDGVLREFLRVLRPGKRVLFSAHEGDGEIHIDDFIDRPVPMDATLFQLDELVGACENAGFNVTVAERREQYAGERTTRLYVEAERPSTEGN